MWVKIQNYIDELSEKINGEIGIAEEDNKVIVSSNKSNIGKIVGKDFGANSPELKYRVLSTNKPNIRHVYYYGEISKNDLACEILFSSIKSIFELSSDKNAKERFLKSVIYSKAPEDTIKEKCREFRITEEVERAVLLICTSNKSEESVFEVLKQIFPQATKDYVVKVSDSNIVVIKELRKEDSLVKLYELANSIYSTISAEAMETVKIGISGTISKFEDISEAYEQAKTAIDIGCIFEETKNIYEFSKLGLGRLIYLLPIEFCEQFLNEILNGQSMKIIDEETLRTITSYFENNLNISETARKLYIHRNTLIYRLDKLEKQIGLDLRNFDSSVLFNIAMLVNKYIKSLK